MKVTTHTMAKMFSACALIYLLIVQVSAQEVKRGVEVPKKETAFAAVAEGQELLAKARALQHPATRAFFYPRIAALLWEKVGADADLHWVVNEVASAGIADIHKHQQQIPANNIAFFYSDLIRTVRRYDGKEADRLERDFPLKALSSIKEQEKVGESFLSALKRYEMGTEQSSKSLSEALRLISSGTVPAAILLGEVLRLDKVNSPALPDVLSATLSLEERRAGSLPFMTIFFLSHVYLKDSTPLNLQRRFLATTLTSVTARMEELRNDRQSFTWATQLLQRSLPFMQALTPPLYPQAASLLATLAPNLLHTETAWSRIKASSDQFEQTLSEVDSTSDSRLKRQLLESAARLAHERGELRRAVDLMTAEKEDRGGMPEAYSYQDEFLDKIVQDAIKAKDIDTAGYAVSKMGLPLYRVESLRRIARHHVESGDVALAGSTLSEAVKELQGAPDGSGKIVAYLRLSTDLASVDNSRASEMIRAAAKAVDAFMLSSKDDRGEFDRSIYTLLNETVNAFRFLARENRAEALNAAGSFNAKEFGVAAALGVNNAPKSNTKTVR